MNVLDGYPDALLADAAAKIAHIEVDPYRHLPTEDQFKRLIDFVINLKSYINFTKIEEVAVKIFKENEKK